MTIHITKANRKQTIKSLMLNVTNKLGMHGGFPTTNLGLSLLGEFYQTHCLLYINHMLIY